MSNEQKKQYDRFPSNLVRALLVTTSSTKGYISLGASFPAGQLADKDREMVILRIGALSKSAYERMQQALVKLMKGKTVIVIAHRLSSIVSADNIVVLKEGRVAQQGRHTELSRTPGVYKNMWDAYTSAYHWTLNKN